MTDLIEQCRRIKAMSEHEICERIAYLNREYKNPNRSGEEKIKINFERRHLREQLAELKAEKKRRRR